MGKAKQTPDKLLPREMLRRKLKRSSTKITTKDGKVKKKVAKQFTLYKCKFCAKKFTDKYNCQSHEKIHYDDVYPCPHCRYKGKTKKYLARHVKNVHSAPTEHKCHVCGKMFHHKCSLNEHIMVHTGEKPHKCDVCGKTFRVTYSLNSHKLIHTNEKPFKCSFCEYACRDSSTLRKHEQRHMGVVKAYTCKICAKKFPEKAKLKYHISEVHLDYLNLDLKRVSCDKCNKTFRSKYNLNKHVQAVHDKSLTCACPVCGQRVTNKHNLPAHLRSHFDERPHVCTHEGCGKRFKDKNTLKKHSIIHSPHLHHACGVCGATFTRVRRLERHARTHQRRERCVECDYCGVTFFTKNYLIKHITHKHCANKQKFVCDLCGLVTYNKPSIVMHLKYGHKYDNDTYCKICKKKYKSHIYLKAHYLKTHNVRYRPMKRCKKKERKPSVVVKVEPIDPDSGEIELLEVHKEEIIDEQDPNFENDLLSYSKHVLSEELAACLLTDERAPPDNTFDEFAYQRAFRKRVKQEDPTQDEIDEEQEKLVTQKIKDIIKNAQEEEAARILEKERKKEAKLLEKKLRRDAKLMRRKRRREIYELEKVRQMYNERMREAAAYENNKKEPAKTIKYFKQKSTGNTIADKQIDKTNNIHNDKDNSEDQTDNALRSNNDSYDTNASLNDTSKVADITENVSSNVSSDDSKNDKSSNESCKDSNDKRADSHKVPDKSDDVTKTSKDMTKELNDGSKDNSMNYKNDGANDDGDDSNDKYDGANDEINDAEHDDVTNDEVSDAGSVYESNAEVCSVDESTGNKRLKFKTHQCYICFKLYPTKEDLISHCSSHFPVCSARTLAKCPVCGHVTHAHIAKHMYRKHGINVTIPYNRITDRKHNSEGSRYCYKMDNTIMEIIPSVKILNHNASIEIDKRNRARKDKTIGKTRLVKKGKEWIVENVAADVSFEELPEFTKQELSKLAVTDSYSDRLGQLNRLAKTKGIKILFPCNRCEKICQSLSALKLHGRRHDPNKKPFAPKKYKRNAKPAPAKEKPEITNLEHRFAKPQPIKNKHKCDDKLKRFYETHVRGADIEFWQFLKIFNKMDRENIQDFKDFEGRIEFGIHTNEDRGFNEPKSVEPKSKTPQRNAHSSNNINDSTSSKNANKLTTHTTINKAINLKKINLTKSCPKLSSRSSDSKIIKKTQYKRVIMINKKQHLEREKAKMKLREKITQKT